MKSYLLKTAYGVWFFVIKSLLYFAYLNGGKYLYSQMFNLVS